MRVVDRIRVPALIITAEDDLFVPAQPFHAADPSSQPHCRVRARWTLRIRRAGRRRG